MKYKIISFSLMVFIFMLSTFSMVNATEPSYMVDTKNQCSVPTVTKFITGGPGESYNVSKLTVPTSTCVKIVFHNGGSLSHTFSIDAVKSDNVTYFNIALAPGKTNSSNFWTPNVNKDYKFFCQVPGHDAAGMHGTLVVGKGSPSKSSPGFGAVSAILSLGAILGVIKFSRMKNKH